MAEFPLWFNPEEYSEFITESKLLFEANIPLQKQKIENRKKITNFDRQTAIRRNNLRMELMRDAAQAKAKVLLWVWVKNLKPGYPKHF